MLNTMYEQTFEPHHPSPPTSDSLNLWIYKNMHKFHSDSFLCFYDCTTIAELISSVCECLKQPDGVWHVAFDIFTMFTERRFKQYCENSTVSLQNALDEISAHSFLQLVSACQIASKLSSHSSVLVPRDCQNFLKDAGFTYSLTELLESEMDLLSTLNYEVGGQSVYSLTQTIMAALVADDEWKASYGSIVDDLKCHVVPVIDIVYLHYHTIYFQLYQTITGNSSIANEDLEAFRQMASKRLELATAVLCVAAYLANPDFTEELIVAVRHITGLATEDVAELSTIIYETLLNL